MSTARIIEMIAGGRTDLVIPLLRQPDAVQILEAGNVNALQWCLYYGDVTALRAALHQGCSLSSLDLGKEIANAAFHGLWKVVDFLIEHGGDPNWQDPQSGETPLHASLSKAGRPHYEMVVRLLLDRGANPNVATINGAETGAFMRDVRTTGEYPLHRAAAFANETTIQRLLDAGAMRDGRDGRGDSPLTWASLHLRPASVLALLAFGPFKITQAHIASSTSDHGAGWGNMIERNLVGEYLPLSET